MCSCYYSSVFLHRIQSAGPFKECVSFSSEGFFFLFLTQLQALLNLKRPEREDMDSLVYMRTCENVLLSF